MKESLNQTRRDICSFFEIFPDFTLVELNRIEFRTLSILPATLSNSLEVCISCRKSIVFREDLNPAFKDFESLSKNLNDDITTPCVSEEMMSLKNKFYATTIQPPTGDILFTI